MNTPVVNNTVPAATGRHEHPPHPGHHVEPRVTRRIGWLDRVALHLGLALITWSRRPHDLASRERCARRFGQRIARLERERAAERLLLLNLPRR